MDPLEYSEFAALGDPLHATFQVTVASPVEYRSLMFSGEDATTLKRALGCLMILRMPEGGLNEALASLRDMLEFYVEVPQLTPPPKRPVRQLTGRAGMAGKRPDLVIDS